MEVLQQIAKLLAINQINRGSTIARRLPLRIRSECSRGDEQSFVGPANHSAPEIADVFCADAAFPFLALKVYLE